MHYFMIDPQRLKKKKKTQRNGNTTMVEFILLIITQVNWFGSRNNVSYVCCASYANSCFYIFFSTKQAAILHSKKKKKRKQNKEKHYWLKNSRQWAKTGQSEYRVRVHEGYSKNTIPRKKKKKKKNRDMWCIGEQNQTLGRHTLCRGKKKTEREQQWRLTTQLVPRWKANVLCSHGSELRGTARVEGLHNRWASTPTSSQRRSKRLDPFIWQWRYRCCCWCCRRRLCPRESLSRPSGRRRRP